MYAIMFRDDNFKCRWVRRTDDARLAFKTDKEEVANKLASILNELRETPNGEFGENFQVVSGC